MTDVSIENTISPLLRDLEGLLFVASGPVAPAQLCTALDLPLEDIQQGLKGLEALLDLGHGLRMQWHSGKVQLVTAPELSASIERFLGLETNSRLSRAALETLAVIAYKQPITRPGIDAIRGVNSDGVLRNLLNKGLVEEGGRAEGPGRPILYGTTSDFLQHFGLKSIVNLPPLEDAITLNEAEEQKLLKD